MKHNAPIRRNLTLDATLRRRHRYQLRSDLRAAAAAGVMLASALAMPVVHAGNDGRLGSKPGHARAASGGAASVHKDDGIAMHGAPLADWTAEFWRWFLSIPLNVSPAVDASGAQCAINQRGPVWFLTAPLGSTETRQCDIPAGKTILVSVAVYLSDYPCPTPPAPDLPFEPVTGQSLEDFLRGNAALNVEAFYGNLPREAVLDGKSLRLYRAPSGLFSFTGAKDLSGLDACITGSPQLAAADGYYAVIGPLSPGKHELKLTININGLSTPLTNTFSLNVLKGK